MRMNEPVQNIDAVHERDLEKLLADMGKLEEFKQGRVLCKFCGDRITTANIYSILPESGSINFICQKPECIAQLFEHMDGKRPQ
jgi:hypothetical protein